MSAICLLGLASQECFAQISAVTPHELLPEQKIVIDDREAPPWKVLWDEARKSAMQGEFETALRQYNALLILKSNLEEARWELARLMMYLKRWDEAAKLLELLIESEPESPLYINSQGKVMWEMGLYERAVDLFKRVYDKNPADQTALAGLVEGMIKLDRNSEALPYLEQLSRQEPTNRGVRRYLAFLLFDAENYEKARAHLTILSRNEDAEPGVLYKTAKTYEHLGLEQQAATYWERVLAREPENVEAHIFLARHYEEVGQLDRSLMHLQAVLAQNPEDVKSFERLGEAYERAGDYDKALAYYEKYLDKYPRDHQVQQRLVAISAAMVKKSQKQATIQNYGSIDDQVKTERLTGAIRKLEAAGRYQDVIPLYRQLFEISPPDQESFTGLANDLIAIGEKKGTVSMLESLAEVAPENISIYRAVAVLFRRLERADEMLSVLHKIHELDPADSFATQELAINYLNRGEMMLSHGYFTELRDSGCSNSRCLEAMGLLAEKLDLPAQRLQAYEALLKLEPSRYDIRLETIALAGRLGLLDAAVFHAGYLLFPVINENLELRINLADAYRESGYLSRAAERYRNIIVQLSGKNEETAGRFRIRSWLGLADAYEKLGLLYEAEQTLRVALAHEESREPILEALFYLFLRAGRVTESEIWLRSLGLEREKRQPEATQRENPDWKYEFLQAEMYSAAGDYDLAIELYRYAESLLLEHSNNVLAHESGVTSPAFQIQTRLVESLLHVQAYAEAEQVILGLQNGHAGKLERMVLLQQTYLAWGKDAKAEKTAAEAREYAAEDFGRQLELAKLYSNYRNYSWQEDTAEQAATLEPESLGPKYLLVGAQIRQGEYFAALELLSQFLRGYPENSLFLSQQAELLAKVGSFQEALGVADMILAENPDRQDIVLLKARTIWEMMRWKDSVALYESVAEPPVEKILGKNIQELKLSVDQTPTKSSWWEALTFSEGEPLTIAQVVMSPQHAVDFSENGQMANSMAAPYYALYRWQDRFSKELSVRRSVMRREYYHAANKLEKVLQEYGSNDFLLYDLAGLYSKLERLGDEADLYRKLAKKNARFPGLADAAQRNNLKRRPKVFLAYVSREDDGWDGYKAVRQKIFKGGGNYYQSTNHDWSIDTARIKYESTRGAQHLWGWRTMMSYEAKLSQEFGLALGGGLERLEGGYDDTPLLYGSVTGKIADEMRAVFSVKQDVVTDTIASLKRNIKKYDYKVEFLFDLFPSILLGGYYNLTDYSDSNWTNNYTFWASYLFLPEPTLLKISYNYDFYDSLDGQKPGAPSEDGFALNDHPYWSPQNYWITRFSFYFKHLISNDALARGVPSYYTIEYTLGYDSHDNDLHELKGGLSFEITKNYIVSGSYKYVDMDVYQQEEVILSIMYRF